MKPNTIKKIEQCNYQCEAGPLILNQDWMDVKREIGRLKAALKPFVKSCKYTLGEDFRGDGPDDHIDIVVTIAEARAVIQAMGDGTMKPKQYDNVATMLADLVAEDDLRFWVRILWEDRHELRGKVEEQSDDIEQLKEALNNGVECSRCLCKSEESICMYCGECYGELVEEVERLQAIVNKAVLVEAYIALKKREKNHETIHAETGQALREQTG